LPCSACRIGRPSHSFYISNEPKYIISHKKIKIKIHA